MYNVDGLINRVLPYGMDHEGLSVEEAQALVNSSLAGYEKVHTMAMKQGRWINSKGEAKLVSEMTTGVVTRYLGDILYRKAVMPKALKDGYIKLLQNETKVRDDERTAKAEREALYRQHLVDIRMWITSDKQNVPVAQMTIRHIKHALYKISHDPHVQPDVTGQWISIFINELGPEEHLVYFKSVATHALWETLTGLTKLSCLYPVGSKEEDFVLNSIKAVVELELSMAENEKESSLSRFGEVEKQT